MTFVVAAILLLAFCGDVRGGAVEFVGERPVNERAVRQLAENPSVSADSLQALLAGEGYLDAVVTAEEGRVEISAGVRYMFDSAVVLADGMEVRREVDQPWRRVLVERLLDSLTSAYESHGYYYATAAVERVERRGSRVTLQVRVEPGPVVEVASFRFQGLRRTRPALLERYLPLEPGDSLTPAGLLRLEQAAEKIPFVRFRPPAAVRPRAGYTSADIELDFSEDRPVTLTLGGGYVPQVEDSRFIWHIDARFNSLFGGGRQARLLSERREADRQILRVSYAQPLSLVGLGMVRGEVATRDYRASFYEFALSGGYEARLRPDFAVGVELGYRSVEPSGGMPSFSAYRVSFSAEWGRVDFPLNPSEGIRVSSEIGYTHRRYAGETLEIPEGGVFNETRTDLGVSVFRRLVGRLVGHVAGGYNGLETSEGLPPLSELILVGGPGTLRGYRNEQFSALRAALVTVEPRIRFSSSYFFAFYDAAYLNNRIVAGDGVGTEELYRSGFGLGMAIADGNRGVKLSLGWNPDVGYDEPRLSIEFSSGI